MDKKDDQIKPLYHKGKFENPFSTWKTPEFSKLMKFICGKRPTIPKEETLNQTLPVVVPNFDCPTSGIKVTWIGHASVLTQFPTGLNVLCDPIFSNYCSPITLFGTKRYRPVPCTIQDLPVIHAVVISHNHYDHLDLSSVRGLDKRFGRDVKWFVPKGLKNWFSRTLKSEGEPNIYELNWWDEAEFEFTVETKAKIACVPAQHWSKRTLLDGNKSLWAGWVVESGLKKFYFAGDTGYCDVFKSIGSTYGPFDLSAIPIGAYCPQSFLSPQHVNVEEAIKIHQDVKSIKSVGIHWGTFVLSLEPYLEPRESLHKLMQENGLDPDDFFTLNHGQSKEL